MIITGPLVSIHIITYNQINFIHDTLRSAVEQDYDNLQVVVADDGSQDGTDDIIMEYAAKYPGRLIPLVGGPHLGITGNGNRALSVCKGKYIAFQGGDDVLLPDKIQSQVSWLEENDSRVLCGHQVEVFYEGSPKTHNATRKLTSGEGPRVFIKDGLLYGATAIMVRASSMPKGGFNPDLPNVSDHLFFIECLLKGGQYGYVSGTYARYRKHANNFTNNKMQAVHELALMFDIIEKKYPQYISECRLGRANLLEYGTGLIYMNAHKPVEALRMFWKSLCHNPRNYKTLFRMAQTIMYIGNRTRN